MPFVRWLNLRPTVIAFNKISNAHKRMARQALAAISLLDNRLAGQWKEA
jgi:hypothetical protein